METASFNAEYIERLTASDPATEKHFYAYFGELLRLKLRSRLRSSALVDDVKQETFLRVLKNLRSASHSAPALEHPERLGGYVNAVCNNVLREAFRAEGRFQQVPLDAPDPVDETITPYEDIANRQQIEAVRQILNQLPEKDRALLRMIFWEDVDKAEVCRQFNVDRDYLRVLLYRARARFRIAFTQPDGQT